MMRRVSSVEEPAYLQPYARAVRRHGGGDFRALLWASRRTQELRFDALLKQADPTGLAVLDLGCGRADLLDFMIQRGQKPRRYVGVEGVRELADSAVAKNLPDCRILVADFVREPRRLSVANADVIYCSGALNTIASDDFYRTIRNAFAAAKQSLVFNFLSSNLLAGVSYLHWHKRGDVVKFARSLTPEVDVHEGYIEGDCTICMRKGIGAQ
jgi:SAM-dependent methyltransferase